MRKTRKKALSWILVWTLLLALLPGAAFAADAQDPVLAADFAWDGENRTLTAVGTAGQEYALVAMNDTLDWSKAIEPGENGKLEFTGLAYATTYELYTRVKGGSGRAGVVEYTTKLKNCSVDVVDGYVSDSAIITVEMEPAEAECVLQWCYQSVGKDGKPIYTPIVGGTGMSYLTDGDDVGKMLAVFVTTRGYRPLATIGDIGPVCRRVESVEFDATSLSFSGVAEQVYLVVDSDEEPNWENARRPQYVKNDDSYRVTVEGLNPATRYDIYTRPVGDTGSGLKTSVCTQLTEEVSITPTENCAVGTVLTATSVPAVGYQWWRSTFVGEDVVRYAPIPGAAGATYTITDYDVGHEICARARSIKGDYIGESDSVFVQAAEDAPEIGVIGSTSIDVAGKAGVEYAVAKKDAAPDWGSAVKPDKDGTFSFKNLLPATEYVVYARAVGSAEEGVKSVAMTQLKAVNVTHDEVLCNGAGISVSAEPAMVGLQYQWYRVSPPDNEEMEYYVPIDGETDSTYTVTKDDEGYYLTVRVFAGGAEVGVATVGPVVWEFPCKPTPAYVTVSFFGGSIIIIESNPIGGFWPQEYVIVPEGVEPDWDEAQLPEFGEGDSLHVEFDGLETATTYHIYTRIVGLAKIGLLPGKPVCTEWTSGIDGVGRSTGNSLVGDTLEITYKVPENADVTCQWCEEVVTPYFTEFSGEEYERHDLIPIPNKTGNSYLITEADLGRTLGVQWIKDGKVIDEVTFDHSGPVSYSTVTFDSCGGSAVAGISGLRYGEKITRPADPTRAGYRFAGWYGDDEYRQAWDFDEDFAVYTEHTLYARWTDAPLYAIDGVVYKNDGSTVAGNATVSLRQGEKTLCVAHTNAEGKFSFSVEAGEYNLVTEDSDGTTKTTKTELLTLTGNQTLRIVMPEEGKSSVVNNELAGELEATVGGLDDVAAALELGAGETVEVTMSVVADDCKDELTDEEKTVYENGKAAIQTLTDARGKTLVFLSLTLEKTVDNGTASTTTNIGGSNTKLLKITIPYDTSGKDNVTVFRCHNGKAEALPTTPNEKGEYVVIGTNSIIIYAMDFSAYAIGYNNRSSSSGEGRERDRTTAPTNGTPAVTPTAPAETDVLAGFSDLDASQWYAEGVRRMLEKGVMNGVGNGLFQPNGVTTRAQVATMLWRLAGSPAVSGAIEFSDVSSDAWYADAVRWASAQGIVTGYADPNGVGSVFDPGAPVTREQFAAMLYRLAQSNGKGFTGAWMFLLDYPDAADVHDWADEAMHWMVMHGVVNGTGGRLDPQGSATRAQVATMLARYQDEMAK